MNSLMPGYICSPLTELAVAERELAKALYSALADRIETVLGQRPFVPHEHYDPIQHSHFEPNEIRAAEKLIICQKTGFLLVVALDPSWGGGIEVGWAEDRGIPILTLVPNAKVAAKQFSRLLQGCSNVVTAFTDESAALEAAENLVRQFFQIPTESVA